MRSLLRDSARKATDHGAVHENTSLVRWEKEEEEEEEKEENMIYRGCELRCIAEIRVESDNHSSEWYIEAWPREENEDEARGLNDDTKNRHVFFSDLSHSVRNGTPFNNATDIEWRMNY